MNERMKYINELVRNGTKLSVITPTCLLDRQEKQECIDYLKHDDDIFIEIHPINDEDTLIEIEMKEGY